MSILRPQFPTPNNPNHKPRLDYGLLPKTGREPLDPNMTPDEYERQLNNMHAKTQEAYTMWVTECVRGEHRPAQAVFTCGHCKEQDPVHPDGMIFTPFKYYLCMSCYHRHMYRKLELNTKLMVECHQCVLKEWERIKKLDPTKVKDFLTDGVY